MVVGGFIASPVPPFFASPRFGLHKLCVPPQACFGGLKSRFAGGLPAAAFGRRFHNQVAVINDRQSFRPGWACKGVACEAPGEPNSFRRQPINRRTGGAWMAVAARVVGAQGVNIYHHDAHGSGDHSAAGADGQCREGVLSARRRCYIYLYSTTFDYTMDASDVNRAFFEQSSPSSSCSNDRATSAVDIHPDYYILLYTGIARKPRNSLQPGAAPDH